MSSATGESFTLGGETDCTTHEDGRFNPNR